MEDIKVVVFHPGTKLILGVLTPEESLDPKLHIADFPEDGRHNFTTVPANSILMFGIAPGEPYENVETAWANWDYNLNDATEEWKTKVASGN